MKKLIFWGVALLTIIMAPGSLTSPNVLAQGDNTISAVNCLYMGLEYTPGAFVQVKLSGTQYLMMQCGRTVVNSGRWIARESNEIAPLIQTIIEN